MAKPIDLGKNWDDMIGPVSVREEKDRTHYPDIYISDIDDPRLLEMPDQGEATIRFKVVSRQHSEHDQNGKKERSCSIRLEVLSIDPPEKAAKKKNGYGEDTRKSFSDYFKAK
jgi:hypothetical protein